MRCDKPFSANAACLENITWRLDYVAFLWGPVKKSGSKSPCLVRNCFASFHQLSLPCLGRHGLRPMGSIRSKVFIPKWYQRRFWMLAIYTLVGRGHISDAVWVVSSVTGRIELKTNLINARQISLWRDVEALISVP